MDSTHMSHCCCCCCCCCCWVTSVMSDSVRPHRQSHYFLLFTLRSSATHLTSRSLTCSLYKREMLFPMFIKFITEDLIHNRCSINRRWDSHLVIEVVIIIGDGDGVCMSSFISLSTLQIPISRTSSFILVCLCVQKAVMHPQKYWEIN